MFAAVSRSFQLPIIQHNNRTHKIPIKTSTFLCTDYGFLKVIFPDYEDYLSTFGLNDEQTQGKFN